MSSLSFSDGKHLSHAYIVSSASREERETLARELAMALVCSGDGAVPCGQCRDCRKAKSGIHPDVITIERQTDDNGRQKREIYVEQVRYMVGDAYVLPNEAPRKVYVINDADTMNPNAQNAALKLLEEPPRAAAFILCAANPGMLLPTVRSRCAEINRNSVREDFDEAAAALSEGFINAVSTGEKSKVLAWCLNNEDMDTAGAVTFTDCVSQSLADMLCCRRDNAGLSRRRIMELIKLMDTCKSYLGVNTGVKHILGLLAVDAVPDRKDNK